jgi:hypothetical protein
MERAEGANRAPDHPTPVLILVREVREVRGSLFSQTFVWFVKFVVKRKT